MLLIDIPFHHHYSSEMVLHRMSVVLRFHFLLV